MLTAEEIREVVVHDCDQRGVRFRSDRFENVLAVYEAHRKRIAQGGDGTTSTRQLARDLYPDVGEDMEAARRKRNSVQRWLAVLVRQGVISKDVLHDGQGKNLGLRVEFRPVSEVTALARGCSSAGSSASGSSPRIPRLKRRRLTAQEACEARVRRWCPRAGRGTPRRFDPPFYSPISDATGGTGGRTRRVLPPVPYGQVGAGARERPGPGLFDAIEPGAGQPSDGSGEVAASERRLTAALGAEAFATWRRAEEAFEAVLGPPAAGRLSDAPSIRALLWALARLDRYGDAGRGTPGAGLSVLEGLLEGKAWAISREGAAAPRHLGYFVPVLRMQARRWKHTWAPRLKAERRARKAAAAGASGRRRPDAQAAS